IRVDQLDLLVLFARAIFSRNAGRSVIIRNVFGYYSIRTYSGAFADGDGAKHLSPRANHNIVFERGVALRLGPNLTTYSRAVIEHDTVANLGGFANNDAHAVVDKETSTNSCTRVDLNSGKEAV